MINGFWESQLDPLGDYLLHSLQPVVAKAGRSKVVPGHRAQQ